MISKSEAIQRLKKMGVAVADDQSIVTILLPGDVPFSKGLKEIKEKLTAMDYDASFCIKQGKGTFDNGNENRVLEPEENDETELGESELPEDTVTEEELKGSLLSMDDDGQFSLGGFGLDF